MTISRGAVQLEPHEVWTLADKAMGALLLGGMIRPEDKPRAHNAIGRALMDVLSPQQAD